MSTVLLRKGVGAVARAWTVCPSRDLMHGTWAPSETCKERAQEIAERLGPITAASLTKHEQRVLPLAGIYPES